MNRASLAVLADGRSGIVVDGDLSDPGWKGAAVVATFFETVFGDNRAPSTERHGSDHGRRDSFGQSGGVAEKARR